MFLVVVASAVTILFCCCCCCCSWCCICCCFRLNKLKSVNLKKKTTILLSKFFLNVKKSTKSTATEQFYFSTPENNEAYKLSFVHFQNFFKKKNLNVCSHSKINELYVMKYLSTGRANVFLLTGMVPTLDS